MLATFSGCEYDDTDVQDRLGNLEKFRKDKTVCEKFF